MCVRSTPTVHQGQGAALSMGIFSFFVFLTVAISILPGVMWAPCPLLVLVGVPAEARGRWVSRGRLKRAHRGHKEACLVLFNSPKLWRCAKRQPARPSFPSPPLRTLHNWHRRRHCPARRRRARRCAVEEIIPLLSRSLSLSPSLCPSPLFFFSRKLAISSLLASGSHC